MLKIIFKNKKKYFDRFPSEKHLEKLPQPHSLSSLERASALIILW